MRKASMLRGLVVAAALAGATVAPQARAGQVFVQAAEHGQGMVRNRGDDCFVIAPDHVIEDADDIEVFGFGRRRAFGWHLKTFPEDVGLVQIEKIKGLDCSEPWANGAGLETRLQKAQAGVVARIGPDGGMERWQVFISAFDTEQITVKPIDPGEDFFKGMSGSTLTIDGEVAGMLMSTNPDKRIGIVLRQDYLTDIVRSFFEIDRKGYDATVAIETIDQPYMVVKNANIRFSPDVDSKKVGFTKAGRIVTVLGRVKSKKWYRVDLGDETIGYMFAPLVEPIAPIGQPAKARAKAATPVPRPSKSQSANQPQIASKSQSRRIFKVQPFLIGHREVPQLTAQVRQRLSSLGNSAVVAADLEHAQYDYLVSGQVLRAGQTASRPNPKYQAAQTAQRIFQGILGTGTFGTSSISPHITRYEAEVAIDLRDRRTGFVTTETGHGVHEDESGSMSRDQALAVAIRQAVDVALNKAITRIAW